MPTTSSANLIVKAAEGKIAEDIFNPHLCPKKKWEEVVLHLGLLIHNDHQLNQEILEHLARNILDAESGSERGRLTGYAQQNDIKTENKDIYETKMAHAIWTKLRNSHVTEEIKTSICDKFREYCNEKRQRIRSYNQALSLLHNKTKAGNKYWTQKKRVMMASNVDDSTAHLMLFEGETSLEGNLECKVISNTDNKKVEIEYTNTLGHTATAMWEVPYPGTVTCKTDSLIGLADPFEIAVQSARRFSIGEKIKININAKEFLEDAQETSMNEKFCQQLLKLDEYQHIFQEVTEKLTDGTEPEKHQASMLLLALHRAKQYHNKKATIIGINELSKLIKKEYGLIPDQIIKSLTAPGISLGKRRPTLHTAGEAKAKTTNSKKLRLFKSPTDDDPDTIEDMGARKKMVTVKTQ